MKLSLTEIAPALLGRQGSHADGFRSYVVADVFTSTPLEGNQLAVFPDAHGLSPEQMQRAAREMNLSETVFMLPAEKDGDVRIRIFTPARELPFAGHPVLGSAFVIGDAAGVASVRIETGAGTVPVELERAGSNFSFGRMQQPVPSWDAYEGAAEVLEALGVGGSDLPVEVYRNGPQHVYVGLGSEDELAVLRPDLGRLAELSGVGIYCFAGSGRQWSARMFAPAEGIPEDPATGSAAGPLAVHLARHGRIPFGQEIEIRQGDYIGRPSLLYARAEGSRESISRVEVGGSAVIVAYGAYRLGHPGANSF